jgi:hypothetical protein
MSVNQALEKYKELYSKYVDTRVNLHNYHVVFIKHLGLESSIGVRKCITEMSKVERQLRALVKEAYREQIEINKAEKKAKRQQKYRNTSGLNSHNRKNVDVQQ